MSMMSRLDTFEPPPVNRSSASPWGVRESMLLLGIVVLLASSGFAVYLLTTRPVEPDSKLTFEFIQQESQNLKPAPSWLLWRTLRADGPKRNQPPDMKTYHEALLRFRLSMAAVLGIGSVGIVLSVVGLWKKGPTPKGVPGP